MARVLILSPQVPAPTGTGGQVRAFHFVRAAAQVADVTLVALAGGEIPAELHADRYRVLQHSLKSEMQRLSPVRRTWRALTGLGRHGGRDLVLAGNNICVARSHDALGPLREAYGTLLWLEASLLRHLTPIFPLDVHVRLERPNDIWNLLTRGPDPASFDYIWCEHSHLFPLAWVLHKKLQAALVTNCHNVETILKKSIAGRMKTPLAARWMRLESAIMRQWEIRMLRACSLLFCCSEDDAKHLKQLCPSSSTRIAVVPNGVDTDHFRPCEPRSPRPLVLFAGTAGYAPNDDAVVWFAERIFPRIRDQIPTCEAVLAGKNADRHWKRVGRGLNGITIASDVPDMRTWLTRAWVCVAPVRTGSGTRLKILEAMGSGKAVVSTTVGAEGLDLEKGKHLLIEDHPDRFADAVVAIIKNASLRNELELAARALAVERFSWSDLSENAANEFRQLIHEVNG